jgi:hypothetical protein
MWPLPLCDAAASAIQGATSAPPLCRALRTRRRVRARATGRARGQLGDFPSILAYQLARQTECMRANHRRWRAAPPRLVEDHTTPRHHDTKPHRTAKTVPASAPARGRQPCHLKPSSVPSVQPSPRGPASVLVTAATAGSTYLAGSRSRCGSPVGAVCGMASHLSCSLRHTTQLRHRQQPHLLGAVQHCQQL